MAISAGARLGAYEILAPLGAGGMGEVWQARDTRLGREVALKVLPEVFAENRHRLARFRREAHLLASLNHPNIAAIHGLEEADGKPFLALELVRGDDLAVRLRRGPIPVPEALEIAGQIVDALEEAHTKGVVHRDLKPANVKLTPEGRVKVLDFGLAKAYADDRTASGSDADTSGSPTLTRSVTLPGAILGTAAYMSPEQASGKALDRRTDIWSFGVVLFEMLTGQRLFSGETTSELLAAVLKEEPPWERLPTGCPVAIVRLLRRCLSKSIRERLQDIGDARLEIADALEGPADRAESTDGAASRELARRWRRERWAWASAIIAGTLAAMVGFRHFNQTRDIGMPTRFVLEVPGAGALDPLVPNLPAVSPDGHSVAFGRPSVSDNTSPLSIRSLVSGETQAFPGTEGAFLPFWSPDGSSVGFFSLTASRLTRIDVASGTVRTISDIPGRPAGGTWNRDGTILLAAGGPTAEIYSVPAAGGVATVLMRHYEKEHDVSHAWPQFLPDGRHFLFSVRGAQPENAGIFVASLDSPNERRRILPSTTRAFATAGHLLFSREGTLLAQPFDPEGLRLTHEATPLAESLAVWQVVPDWAWFSASASGTLAYVGESGSDEVQLVWVDRSGAKVGVVGRPGSYGQLALSPDERQVAVEVADAKGRTDLWILDVARGVSTRLTTDPADEGDPVWSPDGRALVFGSDRGHATNLFRKSLQGSDPETLLLESVNHKYPESWSPDGKTLLYLSEDQAAPRIVKSVWALPAGPGAKPELVLKNGFNLDEPQVSPDGRWLAYASDDSGQSEVYVQPFRRAGERVRVSVDSGGQPRWRRDGGELFYLSMDRRVMSVAIQSRGARCESTSCSTGRRSSRRRRGPARTSASGATAARVRYDARACAPLGVAAPWSS